MSATIPDDVDNDDDDGDDTRLVSVRLYARRRPLLRLDVLPFVLSYTVATTAFFGVPSLEVHALIATPALVFLQVIVAFLAPVVALGALRAALHRVRQIGDAAPGTRGRRARRDLRAAPRRRDDVPSSTRSWRSPSSRAAPPAARRCRAARSAAAPPTRGVGHYGGAASATTRRSRARGAGRTSASPARVVGAMLMGIAPSSSRVLCVLLWSLDDYWYYSLFTLMLVVFECTVVNSRLRHADEMRSTGAAVAVPRLPPRPLGSALVGGSPPRDLLARARTAHQRRSRRAAVSRRRPPSPRVGGGERVDADMSRRRSSKGRSMRRRRRRRATEHGRHRRASSSAGRSCCRRRRGAAARDAAAGRSGTCCAPVGTRARAR